MELSTPNTPKRTFVTPRKFAKAPGNPDKSEIFTAPSTPRSHTVTPKRIQRTPIRTPECFNKVVMETPNSVLQRKNSKEKFDEISNLTVAVRIRPMNSRELECIGAKNVVKLRDENLIVRSNPSGNSAMSLDHIFQYDHIFWSCDETSPSFSSQEDVYLSVGKPLLNSAFRGYNACLFAYGQTGSGKSYSMMGKNNCEIVDDIDSEEHSGLIPRFCRDLFEQISKLPSDVTLSIEISYFEIYNEKIHDLLSTHASDNKAPLKVREHPVWGPYVVDLSMHKVKNYKELRNWLLLGNKRRVTAATSMNEKSSRSHSIFSIEMCLTEGSQEGDCSRRSKVSLVDLAGSERLNSHSKDEKMKQGVCINKSLLTLGKVISALADQKKNQFVPYRDSVLTWLLKECLGGNSLTSMLATITPANSHIDETLATLRYACQARSIINRARVNENPHDRLIRELRLEVERLRTLRQNYERNSLTSSTSSLYASNSSLNNTEELDELRHKLSETENKLMEAEVSWQKKLIETKERQLEELAQVERVRDELESRVRVMQIADKDVRLSPFRSNFLQEIENVLLSDNTNDDCSDKNELVKDIRTWCSQNNLDTMLVGEALIIKDNSRKRQVKLMIDEIKNLEGFENINEYLNSLDWTTLSVVKKLTKHDITSTMNKIYSTLSTLQPPETEGNLNLLYAKVNKSLQSFESALLKNNVSKTSVQKSVSFNIK